jgi:hypothetical protein
MHVVDATSLCVMKTFHTPLDILVRTRLCGVLVRYAKGMAGSVLVPRHADVFFSSQQVTIGDIVVPPNEPVYPVSMMFSYNLQRPTHLAPHDFVDLLYLHQRTRDQLASFPILTKYGVYNEGHLKPLPDPPCTCEWCVKTATASTMQTLYIPLVDTSVDVLDCRDVVGCEACGHSLAHLWAGGYNGSGLNGLLGPDCPRPACGLVVSAPVIARAYPCLVMLFSDREWVRHTNRPVAPWEPVFCTYSSSAYNPSLAAVILDAKTTATIRRAADETNVPLESWAAHDHIFPSVSFVKTGLE